MDNLPPNLDLEKRFTDSINIKENEESYRSFINWLVPKSEFEKNASVGNYVESGWFYFGKDSFRLYFRLYPNGKDKSSENCVSLSITFYENFPENSCIQGTLSIAGTEIRKKFETYGKISKEEIENFAETEKLYWSHVKGKDYFIIQCSIKMKISEVTCTLDGNSVGYHKLSRNHNDHNEKLFKNKMFFDVTFRVQYREIKAHKAILCRIPYFEILFENYPEQIIDIPHPIKYDIFEAVLYFIYTDNIPHLDFRLGSELYVAANTFEIDALKYICSSYLVANLTEKNVIIALQLFNEYDDTHHLKKDCFKFIIKSNADVLAKEAVFM